MSVIWRKVWRDLAHNKLRTFLAVLSIAVGVFSLGLIFGMSGVMRDRMTESHRATLPAHINLWGGPFDQDVVEAVLREPGVADVELEIWRLSGISRGRCDGSPNLFGFAASHPQQVGASKPSPREIPKTQSGVSPSVGSWRARRNGATGDCSPVRITTRSAWI